MDAFMSRKRRRVSPPEETDIQPFVATEEDEDSTDLKLALLASMHSNIDHSTLLEALLVSEGSVENATELLTLDNKASPTKKQSGIGYQASLAAFNIKSSATSESLRKKQLTKKGQTLHLYSPEDIAAHTPCSIIHNFLPSDEANALLLELLEEAPTFRREKFQLFDRVVESPHTMSFYVDSWDEAEKHKTEYVYNGNSISDIRKSLPEMRKVSHKVQAAVNDEVKKRIRDFYPGGKKLQFQSPDEWEPNAAFVNCYDGGAER
jgi:hypothetical protein